MTNSEILQLVDEIELPSLKCGDFPSFTEVWMVRVGDRIYVRSGQYVPSNSWYHAFKNEGHGLIKLGDAIIPVSARVPSNLEEINEVVDKAYDLKYGGKYPQLVPGIKRKELQKFTMEFRVES